MATKKQIRKAVLGRRGSLSSEAVAEKSKVIKDVITAMNEYQEADQVLVYLNYRNEVQTDELIFQALKDGKKVFAPRVEGAEMEFYQISSLDELFVSKLGIREPKGDSEKPDFAKNILMIMPGVAFDSSLARIGYGGGFYDKYLEKHPDIQTVMIAFECQKEEAIPLEETDIRPQMVVTEDRIYRR